MAISLSAPSATPVPIANYNPILPLEGAPVEERTVYIAPSPIVEWIHAGSIDFTAPGLTGYNGVGINRFGLYGANEGTGRFLLVNKSFEESGGGWGNSVAGELRIGDDVRQSSGELIGGNFFWYHPHVGLRMSGSILVNGYVHTGTTFKSDHTPTTIPGEVAYWSGCGINEYGVYGIKAVLSGANHVSSVTKFILVAKDVSLSGDYYFGDGLFAGEMRVGDDIKYDSATSSLEGSSYFWFLPGTGVEVKGNIKATSGTFSGDVSLTGNLLVDGGYIRLSSNTTGVQNTGYISENAIAFYGDATDVCEVLIGVSGHGWLSNASIRIGDNVQGTGTAVPTAAQSSNLFSWDGTSLVIRQNGEDVINTATDYGDISGSDWPDANATDGAAWDSNVTGRPTVLANATNTTISPTYLGATCYVQYSLFIGDSSNYIELNKNSSAPYIKSSATSGADGGYSWELTYDGKATFNTIESVGSYLTLSASVIKLSAASYVAIGDYNKPVYIGGTGSGASLIQIKPHTSGSVTIGYGSGYGYLSITATAVSLNAGGSGILTLGAVARQTHIYGSIVALNSAYIYLGTAAQRVGCFGTTTTQQTTSGATVANLVTVLKNFGILTSGSS